MIGIGSSQCELAVYIANRPPIEAYQERTTLLPAEAGELAHIVRETGNHWRKIINIYGKLGFALRPEGFSTWQNYRDHYLLSPESRQALLFDETIIDRPTAIHLIAGKGHGVRLVGEGELSWIDTDFAVNHERKIVVTPYFDYRQLSNLKLEKLVGLIRQM